MPAGIGRHAAKIAQQTARASTVAAITESPARANTPLTIAARPA
jgi:hypothetical protein